MINREARSRIAQETLAILDAGGYAGLSGKYVEIAAALTNAKAGTQHYQGETLREMATARKCLASFNTTIEVRNESTLAAARRLITLGHRDPLCLNFASAKNPGGGFLGGSEAQEENLAKSSGLYPCLVQKPEMYEANRAHRSCIYLDDMIYSPLVPVFRDDAYALLDEPYFTSIVTAPAVNRGAVARNEPERLAELEEAMQDRIGMLLALAAHRGHTSLVLGAWGCGVFGNRPADMARWFADHLLRNPKYQKAFAHVTFAVLDRKGEAFAAFGAAFNEGEGDEERCRIM